ncbi:MAG: hypothetical protein Kow00121_26640 [Elainellaceae cyanobacterium]
MSEDTKNPSATTEGSHNNANFESEVLTNQQFTKGGNKLMKEGVATCNSIVAGDSAIIEGEENRIVWEVRTTNEEDKTCLLIAPEHNVLPRYNFPLNKLVKVQEGSVNEIPEPVCFHISINRNRLPRDSNGNYRKFNDGTDKSEGLLFTAGFEWVKADLNQLKEFVLEGFTLSGTQFNNGYRNAANALGGQAILIDVDNDFSIDRALEKPWVRDHASMIYTSPSHKKNGEDRFRIIFISKEEVKDNRLFRAGIDYLVQQLGIENDTSSSSKSRCMFGNPNAEFPLLEPNKSLPQNFWDTVRAYLADQDAEALKKKEDAERLRAERAAKAAANAEDEDNIWEFFKNSVDVCAAEDWIEIYRIAYPGLEVKSDKNGAWGCTNPFSSTNTSATGSLAIFQDSGAYVDRSNGDNDDPCCKGSWFSFVALQWYGRKDLTGAEWLELYQRLALELGIEVPEKYLAFNVSQVDKRIYAICQEHVEDAELVENLTRVVRDHIYSLPRLQGDYSEVENKVLTAIEEHSLKPEFAKKLYEERMRYWKKYLESFQPGEKENSVGSKLPISDVKEQALQMARDGESSSDIRLWLTKQIKDYHSINAIMLDVEQMIALQEREEELESLTSESKGLLKQLGYEDPRFFDWGSVIPEALHKEIRIESHNTRIDPNYYYISLLSNVNGLVHPDSRIRSLGSSSGIWERGPAAIHNLVGPSGQGKSHAEMSVRKNTLSYAGSKLKGMIAQAKKDYEVKLCFFNQVKSTEKYEETKARLEQAVESNNQKQIEHCREELEIMGGIEPEKPTLKDVVLVTNGGSVQSMTQLLADNANLNTETGLCESNSVLTAVVDEITGLYAAMSQKTGNGDAKAIFLSIWNQEQFTYNKVGDKKAATMIIPNPQLNILGGIQTDRINEILNAGDPSGLLARILFYVSLQPDKAPLTMEEVQKRIRKNRNRKKEVNENPLQMWLNNYTDNLFQRKFTFELSERADYAFNFFIHNFVTKLQNQVKNSNPRFKEWLAKAGSHCLNLALTLATLNVDLETVKIVGVGDHGHPLQDSIDSEEDKIIVGHKLIEKAIELTKWFAAQYILFLNANSGLIGDLQEDIDQSSNKQVNTLITNLPNRSLKEAAKTCLDLGGEINHTAFVRNNKTSVTKPKGKQIKKSESVAIFRELCKNLPDLFELRRNNLVYIGEL